MSEYKNKVIFTSDKPETRDDQLNHQHNKQQQQNNQKQPDIQNQANKQKQQTDQDNYREQQDTLNTLGAKITFDSQAEFVPMTQDQQIDANDVHTLEDDMVTIIRPKSKGRWWLVGGVASFTGLLGWQSVHNVVLAYQQGDWLSLGWTGFIAALASVGIVFTVKELWKLRRLRRQLSSQEQAIDLIHSHGTGKGVPFCENLAEQAGVTLEHVGFDRWKKTVNANHNDADVIELYDSMVIAQQDKQAKKIVATYSTEAAVLVAVSPLAIADMFLVAWRNFKMIDELGKIYGVELGYWSRIRLLKLVFINMAAAGASELIADVGINVMSMNVAGKISTRAAQGIGIGMLTGRLGIKAMALLRPLPWRKEQAVRLSEIRKLVVGRVIGKSENKES